MTLVNYYRDRGEIMQRRSSKTVYCGHVPVGGNHPIVIQSMTNTDTRDIKKTVEQIKQLEDIGCEIIRVAVVDQEAAKAIKAIKKQIKIPVVGDVHFDYRLAITALENGANAIRINPGNIGEEGRVKAVVEKAKDYNASIRIGVNAGSLEKNIIEKYGGITANGLVESAMSKVRQLEDMDFEDIVVSLKSSSPSMNYDAHIKIADEMLYPLHIGITESGTLSSGKIKSAVGIGSLLLAGIGDTVRVSLTGDPVKEVLFCKELLRATGTITTGLNIVACPTCGRCSVDMEKIATEIEQRLKDVELNITVAIMGCEVNGPGEAKEADIGVAFGKGKAIIFKKGRVIKTLEAENIVDVFVDEVLGFTS